MSIPILLSTLSPILISLTPNANLLQQISPLAVAIPQVGANQPTNGQQLLDQGLKLYQAEKYAEAAKAFQQALAAFQTPGNELNQALAGNYLALAYQQLGQVADAQQSISNSIKLLATKSDRREYLSILAQTLNTQGQLQLAQGQTDNALVSWEEAIKTYSKIGDEFGKIGSQINLAQALQTLGLYRRANNILKDVKKTLDQQPDSLLKVTGLLSLGNAVRIVGDLEESRNVLIKSCQTEIKRLQLKETCPSATNQPQSKALQPENQISLENIAQAQPQTSTGKLGEIFLSLGNAYQALQNAEAIQNPEAALKWRDAALKSYERAANIADKPTTQLQAQLNKLQFLVKSLQTKQSADKEQLSQQVLAQLQILSPKFDSLPPSRSNIYARINYAQSLLKLAKTGTATSGIISATDSCTDANYLCTAAKVLATGIKQAKNLQDLRAESYALGTLGSFYEQTQQWTEAYNLTQQALVLAEGIQAQDIAYRWYWQSARILSASNNPQGNYEKAIAGYDKAVNTLKSLRRDLVAVNRDTQFSFRDDVEPVYRQYVNLLLPRDGKATQENLDKARQIIEALQLAELDNFFRSACLDSKTVKIDNIDQKQETAVIYPIILSDRLAIIVSLPKQPQNQSLRLFTPRDPQTQQTINQDTVNATVEDLRQKLLIKSTYEFLPSAKKVYDWLIRPLEADLQKTGVKNLVFVLDGKLQSVPMSALFDQQKKEYLLQKKYNLAITPGLELLPPTPLTNRGWLATIGGLSEMGPKFQQEFTPLPSVKDELNRIKEKLTTPQDFRNANFTIQNIENAVTKTSTPIVHLATHAQFSSKAEETFILTWNEPLNVNELNTVLKSRQTNQQQAIELLVLSACETAVGDPRAALGLAGVAIQSGARSTLGSVWSVNDEATSRLMVLFYENIVKKQQGRAEALLNAQLDILSGKLDSKSEELDLKFQHPYYWAGFILVGNWQ